MLLHLAIFRKELQKAGRDNARPDEKAQHQEIQAYETRTVQSAETGKTAKLKLTKLECT